MKKKLTTNACYMGALLLFVGAIGCGSAIEMSTNGLAMLGWTLVAVVLGALALVVAAMGLITERSEPKKVHKPQKNTVQPKRQTRKGA